MADCTSAIVTIPLLSLSPGIVAIMTFLLALQFAVAPPLAPVHVQLHGPVPVTLVSVPVIQRLPDGAIKKMALFESPHVPLIGALTDVSTTESAFKATNTVALLGSFDGKLILSSFSPVIDGVNITLKVQVAETANLIFEQESASKVNSGELDESMPIFRAASPEFCKVIVWGVDDWPIFTFPKSKDGGVTDMAGFPSSPLRIKSVIILMMAGLMHLMSLGDPFNRGFSPPALSIA